MFCNKFAPETNSVLILRLSTLVDFLSANFPDIVIQKWLGKSDFLEKIKSYSCIVGIVYRQILIHNH